MKSLAIPLLAGALVGCTAVQVRDEVADSRTAHDAFEQLKSLAGEWQGTAGAGEEVHDTTVTYRVTSAGSVVEERLFAGAPHEMVTMYHMDGDKLMLTHYCAAGNQPSMVAEIGVPKDSRSGASQLWLNFHCVGGTNMASENVGHMHAARIHLEDSNRLFADWTHAQDGKPDHTAKFELRRKTSKTETIHFSSF